MQFTRMHQVIVDMIAASGSVNCPFCSDDGPLVPSHIRPASNAILLLLSEVWFIVQVVVGMLKL